MDALITKGTLVALREETSGQVIVGVVAEDFKNELGYSSWIKLESVVGLMVEHGTFNINFWKFIEGKELEKACFDLEVKILRLTSLKNNIKGMIVTKEKN